jgi:hypothetical protein
MIAVAHVMTSVMAHVMTRVVVEQRQVPLRQVPPRQMLASRYLGVVIRILRRT